MRASDLVARVGGDEFVVLLIGADDAAIRTVTGRIVERLSAPMDIEGHLVETALSIGVSIAGDATTADHLFRDADAAMYRAKARGVNLVEVSEFQLA